MDYPFLVMLDGLVALVNDATGEGGSCGRTGAAVPEVDRPVPDRLRHGRSTVPVRPIGSPRSARVTIGRLGAGGGGIPCPWSPRPCWASSDAGSCHWWLRMPARQSYRALMASSRRTSLRSGGDDAESRAAAGEVKQSEYAPDELSCAQRRSRIRRRASRVRHVVARNSTYPSVPLTRIRRPSWMRWVASSTPTTAGRPSS